MDQTLFLQVFALTLVIDHLGCESQCFIEVYLGVDSPLTTYHAY